MILNLDEEIGFFFYIIGMSLWGYPIKLEQYREDQHDSCSKMTRINRKFYKKKKEKNDIIRNSGYKQEHQGVTNRQ